MSKVVRPQFVAVDATVLISLIKAGRLDLLGSLRGWRFIVPDQVVEEVSYPEQAAALRQAFEADDVHRGSSTDPDEISTYADLLPRMGNGEAACLAMAAARGWMLASDDRGRAFRRLVGERIGQDRCLTTLDIVRIARRQGLISEEEAERIPWVSG